jgi:hypothetical protein
MDMNGQFQALATLCLAKESPVPIGQDAEWTPELVWMLEKNLLPLPGIEPWPSSQQPITIPTLMPRKT